MIKLYPGISPTAAARMERIGAQLVECPRCGGNGFEGPGTGYGDVCSHCGGQKQIRVSGSYASMSSTEQLAFTQSLREARKRGAKAKAVTERSSNGTQSERSVGAEQEAQQAHREQAEDRGENSESSEHPESEDAGG